MNFYLNRKEKTLPLFGEICDYPSNPLQFRIKAITGKKRMTQQLPRTNSESDQKIIEGVIHIHAKGFGFVTPSESTNFSEDVFIPKHLKKNAIDGDLVEIVVRPERKKDKGPEGYVLSVKKRVKELFVGTVWSLNSKGDYLVYVKSFGDGKLALVKKSKKLSYKVGDHLRLRVIDWAEEHQPALCKVEKKIGSLFDAAIDVKVAAKDFDIRSEWPASLLKEVEKLPDHVSKLDLENRLDLTGLETFTIDPKTAKDYDDALSLSKDKKGYHLAVHIADVSHYVKQGSQLDKEARQRGNSTYFPGVCVPMLPEALSNHLCSLKEKEVRLSISVLIDFDKEGEVIDSKIEKAYIFSQKRFNYEEAKLILDQKKKSPHFSTLKLMEELCLILKKKRLERGSVDLILPEIVVQVDKKGVPYGVEVVEYDITHQLVEEFMLKANEIVAEHFIKKERQAIFRVHESPNPENLEEFYSFVRSLGFFLSSKPTQKEIQSLFVQAKESPHLERLSVAFVRSMKMAFYSDQNIGHFGLALENYCHFTSPIRRYSDLVIHRLLFNVAISDLKQVANTCSEKERISFKAESSVILMKKMRLLSSYHKEDPRRLYKGVVSRVKKFGFLFDVEPLQIEGLVHISELDDDYYHFDQKSQSLVGERFGNSFEVGMVFNFSLLSIDLITLECKWGLVRRSRLKKSKREKSRRKNFKKKRR